jgi:hypothetical protein
MFKLRLIYFKLIGFSFVGMAAVKVWSIFVVIWVHGEKYKWGWVDAKFVLVNSLLISAVFCVFATIYYIKNKP